MNLRSPDFLKIRPVVAIFVVAFLVRIAAALYLGNQISGISGAQDEISYSLLGHRLAEGFGLTFPQDWYPWIKANSPQSYFSAAMSMYLAGIYSIFGYAEVAARLITAMLSMGILWIMYLLSKRLFGESAALITAAMGAVYAYLIFYGVTLVTETPFMLALLAAIYLAYEIADQPTPWKWCMLGVSLALTLLFRMAVVFYVPVLIGWILVRRREWSYWALAPLAIMALFVAPFTLRNYRLWGEFALLETQFGHVFWNGNHPGHHGNFQPFKVFPIPDDVLALQNDVRITKKLLAMGIHNVLSNPKDFGMLTLTRLREFFMFWPTSDSSRSANLLRVLSFGIMWPFAVAGIYLSRHQWRDLAPIYLFAIFHTGVYAVTWTMIRYRIPLDAVLIPFAAVAVNAILAKRTSLAPIPVSYRSETVPRS
jgi:4-amino-4-deoxy-L-arabinose transferase-like glycosyltransferase